MTMFNQILVKKNCIAKILVLNVFMTPIARQKKWE